MNNSGHTAAPGVGLGTHSARGLAYLVAGSTVAKLVNIGAQVVLAYLLSKEDFGVVALAYTITVFIQVIEQGGVCDVLIQRRNFRLWAIPGFWLALALGITSSLLIALSAPVASAIFRNEQLKWVMLALAPSSIANVLLIVPRAQLSRQLRFRALAAINVASLMLQNLLTVLFAALGFGPYSFILPVPITSSLMAAAAWWWARPPWSLRPHIRRWRYLIADTTRLLAAELQRAFIDQSGYLLLGIFRTAEAVGLYWFGFRFSIQLLQLFAFNLMNVLFPALTKLNDQPRAQFQGFLKAQRILATFGVSSCLLQAATADPLVRWLLPEKWIPSIIVMQILCLGMSTRIVGGSSYALLKSQGRFSAILWSRWAFVTVQVLGLLAVLLLGGGIASVALVVAAVAGISGPISFYIAILQYGAGWREVADVMVRPVLFAVIAVGTAWAVSLGMAQAGYGSLAQLMEIVVIGAGLNILFAWLWMRPVWDDLWARVWRLPPRRASS
jgi:PST family polysaccharide transporter